MDVIHERCAGIDISKVDVKVTIRVPGAGKRRRKETRTFSSMTSGLLAMRDWLLAEGVTVAGMEATGAVASRMPISWRSSAELFAQILRQRGTEPDAVRDVDAAWDAFGEFCQIEVAGIERPEDDGDGFIAEWGRWDWNDDQPSLSFGRQLAATGASGRDDPEWQPEHWKVELQLVFAEDPAWADLDSLGHQDTGYDFAEIGAPRTAALVEMRRFIESYPQLAAMWRAAPTRSELTLEQEG